MVVLLFFFYKCTNNSCSDEHLFYMALIEALQLHPSIGKGFFARGSGWDLAGAPEEKPTQLCRGSALVTLPKVPTKIRAHLVVNFVPGLYLGRNPSL